MDWFIAHCIGDYIFQNDWMALNKKSHWFPCFVHVILYTFMFWIIGFGWFQLSLIALQHYIQDRSQFVMWYMKISGKQKFASPPTAPWSIFIVDNVFHLVFIYFVMDLPKLIPWIG